MSALCDLSPDIQFCFDRDGRCLLASRAVARWGVDAAGCTGRLLKELALPEACVDALEAALDHVFTHAAPRAVEFPAVLSDGVWHFEVHAAVAPLGPDGALTALLHVRDLTDRRTLGDILADGSPGRDREVPGLPDSLHPVRDLRDRFRQLIQNIEATVWFAEFDDGEMRLQYVNPAYETLSGMTATGLCSDPSARVRSIHPADRPYYLERFETWLHGPRSERLVSEHRMVRPDGTIRWLREQYTFQTSVETGTVSICATGEDITAQRETRTDLEDTLEQFRLITDNTQEVLWISDPSLERIEYLGSAVQRVWGLTPDEARNNPGAWRELVDPADLPNLDDAVERQRQGESVTVDFRIVRPDGQARWLTARSTPMKDRRGRMLVCGVTEDITDRVQHQRRLLEDAERQRDVLVREVHHRIKNSLQGVVGLLRKHARLSGGRSAPLEAAISQVQSIALVHGLQSGRGSDRVAVCDIVSAIARMLEELTAQPILLQQSDAAHRRYGVLEGEAAGIALVLNELMMNAVKHAKGPGTHVSVGLDHAEDQIRVVISNSGVLPAAFRFDEHTDAGTGLGLVRALMPGAGMSVEICNTPEGVRTAVTLTDPYIRVQLPDAARQ
ncbi:MAG: PAS domain S-box protein [Betaproteobacteria bacterium]|nr:PAS domain S-box protein [Betaproteobacteria bacterium]